MPNKAAAAAAETHTVDRTPEYEEFIKKVAEYHKQRETNFDPEPKVGHCYVDLLKLFKHVVKIGGYDKISAEKLAWRKVVEELKIPTPNIAQTSFQLKTLFYRNLAAYEIKTIHNQEPPPKELLEDQSAKGGSLLTRTWENNPFYIPNVESNNDDQSADESTPAREKPTNAPSSRASRGLREAPPQRVLFQPTSSTPSRPALARNNTRNSSNTNPSNSSHHLNTPGGGHAPTALSPGQYTTTNDPPATMSMAHMQQYAGQNAPSTAPLTAQVSRGVSSSYMPPTAELTSQAISGYEPRQGIVVPVMPVATPASYPAEFARKIRQLKLRQSNQDTQPQSSLPVIPGRYEGPNIYTRCQFALRSAVPGERAFALTHLVRISYERGDKFKFDSFPGLVEGLMDIALGVGKLFYDIDWRFTFDPIESDNDIAALNSIDGTSDLLERISCLEPRNMSEVVVPPEREDSLTHVKEAILTLRNMVLLVDNALYLSNFAQLRDLLCILLSLPRCDDAVELKHYALDIAEMLAPFIVLEETDPLYLSILPYLQSDDRGLVFTSLRCLARISMNLNVANMLGNIPPKSLQTVFSLMLLNDEELVDACLDFLYQYTAVASNVERLLRAIDAGAFIDQLVRLLEHGARKTAFSLVYQPEVSRPAPIEVQPTPLDLVRRLLDKDEPARSQAWLLSTFEEDKSNMITQMTVWQAYQKAFNDIVLSEGREMIKPSEFIKNISLTFTAASAQILSEPTGNKFVVRGIRPKVAPTFDGTSYYPCQWERSEHGNGALCGDMFNSVDAMYFHVLTTHLPTRPGPEPHLPQPDGSRQASCRWARCARKLTGEMMDGVALARHAQVHAAQHRPTPPDPKTRSYVTPAKFLTIPVVQTLATSDERNIPQAAGIPLSAALVLANVAGNADKADVCEDAGENDSSSSCGIVAGCSATLAEKLFRPVYERLHEVMADNPIMAPYIVRILCFLNFSGGGG